MRKFTTIFFSFLIILLTSKYKKIKKKTDKIVEKENNKYYININL